MADDVTQVPTQTSVPPPDDYNAIIRNALAQLQTNPMDIPRDNTPVERSWQSKLGEKLAGPLVMQGMTPAEREAAGVAALGHFGTGLLNASGHMQGGTFGTLLGAGFQGAEQGQLGYEQGVASNLAARQEYQQKQQEMQIARIKEAVPLLTLLQQSQQAQTARQIAGSGATPPAGGGTSIATGGSIGAPVTRDPSIPTIGQQGNNPGNLSAGVTGSTGYITAADGQKVGVFPDVPTGIAAHSDTLSGYAGKGINTVADAVKTWVGPNADPATVKGYVADVAKRLGVDPNAKIDLTDPTVQRNFILAQQPHESGKAWLKPEDVDKGIAIAAARRGGGVVARNPGAVQVAGPGAGTPPAAPATDLTGPRPLPPTGPGAGVATPASIANTPVQTAQAQPPAPVATPAQTQPTTPPPSPYPDIKAGDGIIRYPGSLDEYRAHEYVPPPASEVYSPNLTPEKQQSFAVRQQGLELEQRQISNLSDPVAVQKGLIDVKAKQAALQAEMLTAASDKKEAADKALVEYNKTQDERIQKRYEKVAGDYSAAAQSQLASAQKLAEVNAQAGATERTAALNPINTEAGAAAHRLDDLQVLKGFSNNLGDPTFLTSQKIGGHSLADIISGAGLGSQALQDKAGQAQAFRAAALSIVRDLRMGGSAAGEPRSNQDLQFITSMVPSEMQSPATRNAIISYIEQVNQRRMEYGAEVGRLVNTPQYSNNVGGAMLAAREGMKDIVQPVPKEIAYGGGDVAQQRLDWFRKNVPPGSFYRAPNGRMQVWHGVKGDPDYAE